MMGHMTVHMTGHMTMHICGWRGCWDSGFNFLFLRKFSVYGSHFVEEHERVWCLALSTCPFCSK